MSATPDPPDHPSAESAEPPTAPLVDGEPDGRPARLWALVLALLVTGVALLVIALLVAVS